MKILKLPNRCQSFCLLAANRLRVATEIKMIHGQGKKFLSSGSEWLDAETARAGEQYQFSQSVEMQNVPVISHLAFSL